MLLSIRERVFFAPLQPKIQAAKKNSAWHKKPQKHKNQQKADIFIVLFKFLFHFCSLNKRTTNNLKYKL